MSNNLLKNLLKQKNIRVTQTRLQIISTLFKSDHKAISQSEIELALGSFDRVTVYRTLKLFVENGIVHAIDDGTGKTKYALCEECTYNQHTDDHLHFRCTACLETICLDNIAIPKVNALNGYSISHRQYTVTGVCRKCNLK